MMKIKGIKRGQIIELLEEVNVPDNSEIIIEISSNQLNSKHQKRKRIQELLGHWEKTEEFFQILSELKPNNNTFFQDKEVQQKTIEVLINGEEAMIKNNEQAVVKLTMKSPVKRRRQAGSAKGLVTISDDFDAPLEEFKEYM